MGNSEVGHLTIGSGRVLFQDLMRVNLAIRDGSFFDNPALVGAFARARERGGDVHLLGLVSHGGVHSHLDHLLALLELARRQGMEERTWIHAFTDGRDVSPHAAATDLAQLPAERIATVVGRYYAMDRDNRAERTERAVGGDPATARATQAADPVAAVRASYEAGIDGRVRRARRARRPAAAAPGRDAAIFFNFRPDRGRQLSRRLLEEGVDLTTMTRYAEDIDTPVAFPEQDVRETLAEVLSSARACASSTRPRRRSTRTSPTSSTAARSGVGGRDAGPRPLAARRAELRPAAGDVRGGRRRRGRRRGCSERLRVLRRQLREPGHGRPHRRRSRPSSAPSRRPTRRSARSSRRRRALGGVCLVTADHGNAEIMLEPDGVSPHTAHTTNPVPLVLTAPGARAARAAASLADLAPTVLDLLGIAIPAAMTGRCRLVDDARTTKIADISVTR